MLQTFKRFVQVRKTYKLFLFWIVASNLSCKLVFEKNNFCKRKLVLWEKYWRETTQSVVALRKAAENCSQRSVPSTCFSKNLIEQNGQKTLNCPIVWVPNIFSCNYSNTTLREISENMMRTCVSPSGQNKFVFDWQLFEKAWCCKKKLRLKEDYFTRVRITKIIVNYSKTYDPGFSLIYLFPSVLNLNRAVDVWTFPQEAQLSTNEKKNQPTLTISTSQCLMTLPRRISKWIPLSLIACLSKMWGETECSQQLQNSFKHLM